LLVALLALFFVVEPVLAPRRVDVFAVGFFAAAFFTAAFFFFMLGTLYQRRQRGQ
jgi:hypothetical protein